MTGLPANEAFYQLTGYDLEHERILETSEKVIKELTASATTCLKAVERSVTIARVRGTHELVQAEEGSSAAATALRILEEEHDAPRYCMAGFMLSDRALDRCTVASLRYLAVRVGLRLTGAYKSYSPLL